MDSVRTDQNIAFHGEPFTRRESKACFDLAVRFVPALKGAIDMNATRSSCLEAL
jgi:hypothetical protein